VGGARHDRFIVAKPVNARREGRVESDPLLALRGSGRSLWADGHADEYVKRLRGD
jgi:hypothetical protein